jgi:hypothetical protein
MEDQVSHVALERTSLVGVVEEDLFPVEAHGKTSLNDIVRHSAFLARSPIQAEEIHDERLSAFRVTFQRPWHALSS